MERGTEDGLVGGRVEERLADLIETSLHHALKIDSMGVTMWTWGRDPRGSSVGNGR